MFSQVEDLAEIEKATEIAFRKADAYFAKTFVRAQHKFDLRGTTAGQAIYSGVLRWNLSIYRENKEEFLKDTVPHEVAHLVADAVFGKDARNHGPHWQNIMINVFGLEPNRTHSYKSGVKKTRVIDRDWVYECENKCEVYNLSTVRHNKIERNSAKYCCRHCKGSLVFIGKGLNKKGAV